MILDETRQQLVLEAFIRALEPFWRGAGRDDSEFRRLLTEKLSGVTLNADVARDSIAAAQRLVEAMERTGGVSLKSDGRLAPIFENSFDTTDEPKSDYRYPLVPLGSGRWTGSGLQGSIFPVKVENVSVSERKEHPQFVGSGWTVYQGLWRRFLEEVESLPTGDFESIFTSLYYLVQKYTWCIPSRYVSEDSSGVHGGDVPLFDTAQMVALLTDCLHPDPENAQILFIYADLSGIQHFLYKIRDPEETTRRTAVRLRGRSFYLNLLLETFAHYLLEQLELSVVNLIWCEGGNFLIVAPHTVNRSQILCDAKTRINGFLLEQFRGDLYLNLEWGAVEAGALTPNSSSENEAEAEAGEFVHQGVMGVLNELQHRVTVSKQKKFLEFAEHGFLFPLKRAVCAICDLDIAEEDIQWDAQGRPIRRCPQCQKHHQLGHQLVNLNKLYRIHLPQEGAEIETGRNAILFEEFGMAWRLETLGQVTAGCRVYEYSINDADFLPSQPRTNRSYGFRFLANAVAINRLNEDEVNERLKDLDSDQRERIKQELTRDEDGNYLLPYTFDEFAAKTSANRVGVLRMDVDDLGARLAGMRPQSLVRLSAVSRMLGWFFSGYVDALCREKKVAYVVYSGGDDNFLVAPFDTAVEIACAIHQAFRQYTCEQLDLSAGLFLARGKFPIGRGAHYAAENLRLAKEHIAPDDIQKRAIRLFEQSIDWERFVYAGRGRQALKLLADELIEQIRPERGTAKVSRGFIWKLLRIYEACRVGDDVKYTEWMGRYRYLIARDLEGDLNLQMRLLDPHIMTLLQEYTPLFVSYIGAQTRGGER